MLSLETVAFSAREEVSSNDVESLDFAFKADCGSSGSAFVAFWLGGPPDEELCLLLDHNGSSRTSKRSIRDLEKTKYSLVANGSNYTSSATAGLLLRSRATGKNYPELVSFANKLTVRFFSKNGRFAGTGFRARFKIGKLKYYAYNYYLY